MATFALDMIERLVVILLYLWLVSRIVGSMAVDGRLVNGLLLASEGLVIVFLVTRRPTDEVSRSPLDWLLALAATCCPLLVNPSHATPMVPEVFGASLWMAGTLIQVSAKIALGRSFGCVAANRGSKCGGPYHFVRHPMYAGYLISHIAFLTMNPTWHNLLIYFACDLIQIPRIMVEERILTRDPIYRSYCDQVTWRIIPGVF